MAQGPHEQLRRLQAPVQPAAGAPAAAAQQYATDSQAYQQAHSAAQARLSDAQVLLTRATGHRDTAGTATADKISGAARDSLADSWRNQFKQEIGAIADNLTTIATIIGYVATACVILAVILTGPLESLKDSTNNFAKADAKEGVEEFKSVVKSGQSSVTGVTKNLFLHGSSGTGSALGVASKLAERFPDNIRIAEVLKTRDEQLKLLADYNTVDLVEPPILEDFSTERLGTGIEVWCVQRQEKHRRRVVELLGYAFRNEELETDLHLKAMCPDLGWLQGAMPHIDEFVRAISIVPKQQKAS